MTKSKPAFPRPASEYTASGTLSDGNDAIKPQDGISIRQYYAAKAMQSLLEKYDPEKCIPFNDIAMDAFCMANAMIGFENKEGK